MSTLPIHLLGLDPCETEILAGGERHARGHEDACGGKQVALATVLTPPALQSHGQLSMG